MESEAYAREKEEALYFESLGQAGQWSHNMEVWRWTVGADRPDQEWLSSDFDTWEKNPHYRGEPGPHPEDY